MPEQKQQAPMHEQSDINVRGVMWGGVAIVAGIVLAVLASYFLLQMWNAPSGSQPLGGPNTGFDFQVASPQLQASPQQERARYFAEKERLLDSYAWIDRRAGIARIPLEQAMQIMAARDGAKAAPSKEQP